MTKYSIKTNKELDIMKEGGSLLAEVKKELRSAVKKGVTAGEIEALAVKEIKKRGGEPSFKMVPQYSWATCINVNSGVVHGIPHNTIVFKDGDVVSVDVGMYYKNFHTDTSFTKIVGDDKLNQKFLELGKKALNTGIKKARPGNKIRDISKAIEDTFTKGGATPIRALTGHGIGKNLHEAPLIPCYVSGVADEDIEIVEGMALAIEVMYTKGSHRVKLAPDGWTILTKDGKIASLFEETVAIRKNGPEILTA